MPQPVSKHKRTLRRTLKAFLDLRSKDQPGTTHCTDCGSICEHLPAHFWLDGDKEAFSILLPFCPQCNPELFAEVPAIA